ncbi:MAG: hypothetical protein V3S17_03195 [candidate division Zixibacteria bacterium]
MPDVKINPGAISKYIMLIVVIIVALANVSFANQNERPNPDLSPTTILEKSGVKYAYPHWSADGSRILYQSDETGNWQIYTAKRDGSDTRQITDGEFNNYFADWSPDNSQIVFVSDRTGNEEIFVMNVDGTDLLNLSNSPSRDIHPYWSPDGTNIVFNSSRSDPKDWSLDVFQIKPDGSGIVQLTRGKDVETCASTAPGGEKLVFLKMDFEKKTDDIVICNADGSDQVKITDDGDRDGWPAWSPDGSQIVFSSMYYGSFCLHVIDVTGKNRLKLTSADAGQHDCRAQFSSDGKELLFNRDIDDSTIAIMVLPIVEVSSKSEN